jgi:hypothetical protein
MDAKKIARNVCENFHHLGDVNGTDKFLLRKTASVSDDAAQN